MKLLKNIELKLVSVAIATVLWVMVTGKEYRYGDFDIPIEMTGISEKLIISRAMSNDQEVKTAMVRIRAQETTIKTLDKRSMYIRVDVSGLNQGEQIIQLTGDMVMGRPLGAEITEITPRVIELTIEKNVLRDFVVINPSILGKPAEGYDIEQLTCIPSSLIIRGPESIVAKIENVTTPPIRVDGLTHDLVQKDLPLVPPSPLVTLIPGKINLRVEIREKQTTKVFGGLPVAVRNAKFHYRINPTVLGVTVKGPVSQLTKLQRENLVVFVALIGGEAHNENLRMEPQFECVPADSFPDVSASRFSQSYVNIYLTDTISRP